MDEAALGTEIEVPLLDARVRMKIPAGTQPGSVFRVRGKGLPAAGRQPRRRPCAGAGRSARRVQRRGAGRASSKLAGLLGDDAYPRQRAFQEMMAVIGRGEGE